MTWGQIWKLARSEIPAAVNVNTIFLMLCRVVWYKFIDIRMKPLPWQTVSQFRRLFCKVVNSNPDKDTDFIYLPNFTKHKKVLQFTQLLTQMRIRKYFWGLKRIRQVNWQLHRHLWADFLDNAQSSTSHNPISLHWNNFTFFMFKYLGTTVTNQNLIQEDIKRRLNSGNACYHSVQNHLPSCLLSKNVKVRIYKTIIFARGSI
jgi:hypothetical protein